MHPFGRHSESSTRQMEEGKHTRFNELKDFRTMGMILFCCWIGFIAFVFSNEFKSSTMKSKYIVTIHSHVRNDSHHDGVIVLGMHRSGTSLVAGLLFRMGFQIRNNLIGPLADNPTGFFERYDIIHQNDILMIIQDVSYDHNLENYNASKGLEVVRSDTDFYHGAEALAFLNDSTHHPYMLKDPRLCVTIRTWLPLLRSLPAILFTFRHPFDVALSMHQRTYEQFRIVRGLRLWDVYNRRAIQQSQDLCRVVTSHRLVMSRPKEEMDRIYKELREVCGVDIPRRVSDEDVATFVDVKLQHGRSGLIDDSCHQDVNSIVPPSTWPDPTENELAVYR